MSYLQDELWERDSSKSLAIRPAGSKLSALPTWWGIVQPVPRAVHAVRPIRRVRFPQASLGAWDKCIIWCSLHGLCFLEDRTSADQRCFQSTRPVSENSPGWSVDAVASLENGQSTRQSISADFLKIEWVSDNYRMLVHLTNRLAWRF